MLLHYVLIQKSASGILLVRIIKCNCTQNAMQNVSTIFDLKLHIFKCIEKSFKDISCDAVLI